MGDWLVGGFRYRASTESRVWGGGGTVSFKATRWNETLHPRDRQGQFSSGDTVRLSDGGRGTVLAVTEGGTAAVARADGRRALVPASDLSPDLGLPDLDPQAYYDLPESKISEAENASLMNYRGNGYAEINRQLREFEGDASAIDDPEIKRHVTNLDRAIKRNKLDRPLTVYRGVGSGFENDLVEGAELDVRSFSSTSMSPDTAHRHGHKGMVMQIELPKGTPALKAFDGDFEILLPRDMVLVVDRVENGVVHVRPE